MKILLLTVTAGQGHNSCAASIAAELTARGVDHLIVDTIKYVNSALGRMVDKGYAEMCRSSPAMYGGLYNAALKSSTEGFFKDVNIRAPQKLVELVTEYNPDAIICTHIFACIFLTDMRSRGLLHVPVIGINTDFALHPYWEYVDLDKLVVPCSLMDYAVCKRGVPDEKLLTTGIPINSKFNRKLTTQAARKELELEEKPMVTIIGGTTGFGKKIGEHLLELCALPYDFQITVICAGSKKLYRLAADLVAQGALSKEVRVYGYVKNVEVHMYASDIICTKPGGLTMSEALCVGRPIVLTRPIPGIEDFNAAFLASCGAVVKTDKHYSLSEAIYNILSSPIRTRMMMTCQREIARPRASADLVDEVFSMLTGVGGERQPGKETTKGQVTT